MKIFKTERIGNPEEFVHHMKKEMEIVQGLGLNSVPRYYEFKEDILAKKNGLQVKVFFLVMEYIHGVTLFDFFIKMKSQEDKFVRYIFRQVAYSLHKLHQAGIAHRDIKPENVMLTEEFQVKIIDLGYWISLAGRQKNGFTSTFLGTDMYMATEIVEGRCYQGADVDIFALGVMLLTVKAMIYPFDSAKLGIDRHYTALQQNPKQFWEQESYVKLNLSEDFKELVALMLKHNPMARPTIADVLGHQWMRGEVPTKDEFNLRFK